METSLIDARVASFGMHLRRAETTLQPHEFLAHCVAAASRLGEGIPEQDRAYLAERLDTVLAEYALDACRLVGVGRLCPGAPASCQVQVGG